jgi:hypothetical protein
VYVFVHGSFNTATGAFLKPFEVLQREVYVTLLMMVQGVTLQAALAIFIGATRGRLGYDAPERELKGMEFTEETEAK